MSKVQTIKMGASDSVSEFKSELKANGHEKQIKQVDIMLRMIETYGFESNRKYKRGFITNIPQYLELFECRSNDIRLFVHHSSGVFTVLSGYLKRSGKTPSRILGRAIERMKSVQLNWRAKI